MNLNPIFNSHQDYAPTDAPTDAPSDVPTNEPPFSLLHQTKILARALQKPSVIKLKVAATMLSKHSVLMHCQLKNVVPSRARAQNAGRMVVCSSRSLTNFVREDGIEDQTNKGEFEPSASEIVSREKCDRRLLVQ